MKVVFVGAGPGDPELLTLRGKREIESADVILYAGSLIHKDILSYARDDAILIDSYGKSREEISAIFERFVTEGKKVVRLHSGDLSFYSAIQEQMEFLTSKNIEFELVPGVSSFSAASASLKREFTSPGVSQTLIITKPFGKTGKPAGEGIKELSKHGATMVIFLGVHLIDDVVSELRVGYPLTTPVAVVHKASWREEKIIKGTLGDIIEKVRNAGVKSQSVIIVGDVLEKAGFSKLYSGGEKNHEITQD
jgi:precorrin-4/cobalt-precorrin-4 C11-methyltransferase